MSGWVIAAVVVAALAALVGAWRWYVRRLDRRGIATGMTVRTARMGGLMTRSLLRKARLKIHRLLVAREHRKELEEAYHLKSAEEAAALMGNMKGVFMKLGQIVSFASESMPESAQQALRGLQQDAPPMTFEVARTVLEADLGDLGGHFKHVDEEPLAAASIGQVHRARLRDGTQVVVKVQYPGVAESIENDLKFAGGIATMIQAIHKNADSKAIVAELKERLLDEVDYRKEARNQQLFGQLWGGHPLVRIPRVFPEHSGRHVLCQQFAKGMGFYDFLEVANRREKQLAVMVLNDFVFDSMHRYGVFNGDPHPGNYLFHEDGGVTFLDFGCVKYFTRDTLERIQRMNRAIVEEDHEDFDACMRELKLVLPGRPYDHDFFWDFFAYHAEPFTTPGEFSFTRDWVGRAAEVMTPGNLRRLNLPPDLVFFNRITFGLNSIFEKLGASADFHTLYRRYIYPDEGVAPALAHAGVELPERFMEAGPAPLGVSGAACEPSEGSRTVPVSP